MGVTPFYLHEYTISPMNKEKVGIQQVKIIIVTDSQEPDNMEAIELTSTMLEYDLNIGHRILLTGYREDK